MNRYTYTLWVERAMQGVCLHRSSGALVLLLLSRVYHLHAFMISILFFARNEKHSAADMGTGGPVYPGLAALDEAST